MSKHRILGLTLATALAATILPAAAAAQDEPAPTPEGTVWSLAAAGDLVVPGDVQATLFMESGEANGTTGCNSFSTTYSLDGESLTFAPEFAVTQAFCEGPAGEVEQAYMAALPTVASWSIDDSGELSLADGEQTVVLVFAAPSPTVDLTEADIDALITELERLNQRINNTRQDVRELQIPRLSERVAAGQAVLEELARTVDRQNVPGLRDRVVANEAVLKEVTDRFVALRQRVRDLERRVARLEEATFRANPQND